MKKNNELGNTIRSLRKAKGFTQESFAERAQVSLNAVKTIETSVHTPSIETLVKIAKALGTTTDELLHGHEYKELNSKIKGKTNFTNTSPSRHPEGAVSFDLTTISFSGRVLESLAGLSHAQRQFALALIFRDESYLADFDDLNQPFQEFLKHS